jgi:hypothetical protein
MTDELIPSAGRLDDEASKTRASNPQDRPAADEGPQQPQSARRRTPQMPDLAELVEQLRQASGLVTLGILSPAKANVVVRCIAKSIDTVMRSQLSTPGAPNQPGLVEACRENPKIISLLESLLTDDQLTELLRQVNDDAA